MVPVKVLGSIAIAEALSFIALLGAMVFKYGFDQPVGVTTLGPIHGGLFLAYVALALLVAQQQRWGLRRTGIVLAAAVIPVAGYLVGRRLVEETTAVPQG